MSISQTYNLIAYPRNIYFSNSNVGFTLGGDSNLRGNIQKTTDGGANWVTIYNTQQYLLGFTLRGNNYFGVGNLGTIVKSIDKGLNWTTLKPPTNLSLTDIDFTSDSTGYTVGGGYFEPVFLKTTDEGNSWVNIPININLDLYGVSFINDKLGFLVGNRIIWKTTDGGKTLTSIYNNNYYLFTACVVDTLTAFAGGDGPLILRTTNGGNSWNVNYSTSLLGFEIVKIKFYGRNFGIAVSKAGLVIRTTTRGDSWDESFLTDHRGVDFHDIFILDENTAWISGTEDSYGPGILYKTTNGGVTWNLLTKISPLPSIFKIFQNYPNPFNTTTGIRYDLTGDSKVVIVVYDITGREVKVLVNEQKSPGTYQTFFDGSNFASGLYFYKINITDYSANKIYTETKKMVLTK